MTGGEYYRAMVKAVQSRGHYFKATRANGRSFVDSSFRYVVGETATAKGDKATLCEPGLLHFSDVPADTLAGRHWPCRLFEVRPSEVVVNERSKYGAKSLYVVRDLPAWLALGPNGRVVARFLTELAALDHDDWVEVLGAARDEVESNLAGWGDAARAVAALVAARNVAAWHVTLAAARGAARWVSPHDVVQGAVWYGAGVLVVADLIAPKRFATLYAPFAEVLPLDKLRERAIAAFPLTVQP